jgi:hypothetical protein
MTVWIIIMEGRKHTLTFGVSKSARFLGFVNNISQCHAVGRENASISVKKKKQ